MDKVEDVSCPLCGGVRDDYHYSYDTSIYYMQPVHIKLVPRLPTRCPLLLPVYIS